MYYPVATALCEVFNENNSDKNIFCKAKISNGAEFNLNAVENGEFDMGISQANLQYDAFLGRGKFADNPHKKLRTLFGVHSEYMTIIAKKDSNINSFSDLKGKKVNIGNIGSGSRILFEQMIKKLGWELSDFKEIYGETGSDINKVLCVTNKADAAVYIVGNPNVSFGTMLDKCNTKLVDLSKSEINKFISLAPEDFFKTSIPKNTYKSNPKQVQTFASRTVLSTSSELSPKIVDNFVKIIRENKDELIKKQPSLSTIDFFEDDDLQLAPKHNGIAKKSGEEL
jgi:TRAP transporter TAXI family solute receptor